MNKCNKYSRLILKDVDGIINNNELKALNEHIKICKKCEEEYKLIKKAKVVLQDEKVFPLPDNFKMELREKLVDYNMNKAPLVPFYKKLNVNLTATLCLAVFITAFSLNYNSIFKNDNKNELESQIPATVSETERSLNTKDIASVNQKTILPEEKQSEQTSKRSTAAETENILTNEEACDESLLNVASEDFNEDIYLTLTVDDSLNIKELISYTEVIDYDIFFVPMAKLSEVKEILKEYTLSNENEETLSKDKFIIKQ